VSSKQSYIPSFSSKVVGIDGKISEAWFKFFQLISGIINYFGQEQYFELVNNQASALPITGLSFDARKVSLGFIKYAVQRTTDSNESVGSGILLVTYKPRSQDWDIDPIHTYGSSGVTFTITSSGQVEYETDNQAGTKVLSRIFWRTETLAGKAYYSGPN